MKSLDKMIEEGKKVDYVFGDLTDIPVTPTPQGEIWDFIRLIITKTFQALKPTGKFMTHVSKNAVFHATKILFTRQYLNITQLNANI